MSASSSTSPPRSTRSTCREADARAAGGPAPHRAAGGVRQNPAIIARAANHTFYPYGYLQMADSLCFWVRELRQVENQTGLSSELPPDCVF
jgi:hypothetical protein